MRDTAIPLPILSAGAKLLVRTRKRQSAPREAGVDRSCKPEGFGGGGRTEHSKIPLTEQPSSNPGKRPLEVTLSGEKLVSRPGADRAVLGCQREQESGARQVTQLASQCALNVKSKVLLSPAAIVIFCVSVPNFSCHAWIVYSPGGRFGNWKLPSLLVTAKYGCLKTAI